MTTTRRLSYKICEELSLSVTKPAPKFRAARSSRQHSINFIIAADESESPTIFSLHVCICLYYFVSYQLVVIFIYFPCGIFSAMSCIIMNNSL